MWRKAFFCIVFGAVFYLVGSVFAGPARHFMATADPAMLVVLQVDEKRGSEGKRMYRPVFALDTDTRPRPEYAGSIWTSRKPHQVGDVVAGQYDPVTGEMRSTQMARKTLRIGRIAQLIGALVMLQGVLLLFGLPNMLAPLRVRWR